MKRLIHLPVLFLSLSLLSSSCSQFAWNARHPASYQTSSDLKEKIKIIRAKADRSLGLVQLTGKDIILGQTKFPMRTPADPFVFEDKKKGEVHVYGTQVDGTGFSYLKYKSKNDLLRGVAPEIVSKEVYLPNGQKMEGKEAIWDTYRLSYEVLEEVFGQNKLRAFYKKQGIEAGTDLYFGGIALQENGELGRWTLDNWRRRVHAMAWIKGKLQILTTPVFNPIPSGLTEKSYPGFGLLPFLKGDYIGHAYGPNFKVVHSKGKKVLWIISEEVTRRYEGEKVPAEVTEIMARPMVSPLEAKDEPVLMASVDGTDGRPHPDSDRGEAMAHTKLIEGFRPTSLSSEGIRIQKKLVREEGMLKLVTDKKLLKKEYFFLTGSPGNFAGDDYDCIVAVREKSPIGLHRIIQEKNSSSWKRFLSGIKKNYRLSWAGRGSFVKDEQGEWWLLFHAVDKDLKPDGSYGGIIPPNTEEYHRNLYAVPIEFIINEEGEPDMRLLMAN